MITVSQASAMSAPAEIARWFTNAMVRTGRVDQRIAHRHRRIDATTEGVDVEHHCCRARGLRFADGSCQERRHTEINHSLDRDDVHDRGRGLRWDAVRARHT
jgi:hypothetical protein